MAISPHSGNGFAVAGESHVCSDRMILNVLATIDFVWYFVDIESNGFPLPSLEKVFSIFLELHKRYAF